VSNALKAVLTVSKKDLLKAEAREQQAKDRKSRPRKHTEDFQMATPQENCRHCGQSFIPMQGKPGYIDECPECLYLKSARMVKPLSPASLTPEELARVEAIDQALKSVRAALRKRKLSKDEIDSRMSRIVAALMPDTDS
jgi:hypothetical protein